MTRRFYSSRAKKKSRTSQKLPPSFFERWSLRLEELSGWPKLGLFVLSFVVCFLLGSFLGLVLNRPTVTFLVRLGKLSVFGLQ